MIKLSPILSTNYDMLLGLKQFLEEIEHKHHNIIRSYLENDPNITFEEMRKSLPDLLEKKMRRIDIYINNTNKIIKIVKNNKDIFNVYINDYENRINKREKFIRTY